MELYQEILVKVLQSEEIHVCFPNMIIDANAIVNSACYNALSTIRQILDDDSLSDSECFNKIEEIIRVFESLGSNGGNRHDF